MGIAKVVANKRAVTPGLYKVEIVKNLDRAKANKTKLEALVVTLTAEIAALQAKLPEIQAKLNDLATAINKIIDVFTKTIPPPKDFPNVDTFLETLSKLSDKKAQINEDIAEKTLQKIAAERKIAEITSAVDAKDERDIYAVDYALELEIGQQYITAEINTESKEIRFAPHTYVPVQQDVDYWDAKIAKLYDEFNSLTTKLSTAEAELAQINADKSKIVHTIAVLTQQIVIGTKDPLQLLFNLQLQEKIDRLTDELEMMTAKSIVLAKKILEIKDKIKEKLDKITEYNQRKTDINDSLAAIFIPPIDEYTRILQPTISSGAPAWLFNKMLLPGVQKWMPTYRTAHIFEVDYATDKCTVTLVVADSSQKPEGRYLKINKESVLYNVPIKYGRCNSSVFEVGDYVIVSFEGDWETPIVIGFAEQPKVCGGGFLYFDTVTGRNNLILTNKNGFVKVLKDINLTAGFESWINDSTTNPELQVGAYIDGNYFFKSGAYQSPDFTFSNKTHYFALNNQSVMLLVYKKTEKIDFSIEPLQVFTFDDVDFNEVLFVDAKSDGTEFLVHFALNNKAVPFDVSDYSIQYGLENKWQAIARYSVVLSGDTYTFATVDYKEFVAGMVFEETQIWEKETLDVIPDPDHYFLAYLEEWGNYELVRNITTAASLASSVTSLYTPDIVLQCYYEDDVYTEKVFEHQYITLTQSGNSSSSYSEVNHSAAGDYVHLGGGMSMSQSSTLDWHCVIGGVSCHITQDTSKFLEADTTFGQYSLEQEELWNVDAKIVQLNDYQRYSALDLTQETSCSCTISSNEKHFLSSVIASPQLIELPEPIYLTSFSTCTPDGSASTPTSNLTIEHLLSDTTLLKYGVSLTPNSKLKDIAKAICAANKLAVGGVYNKTVSQTGDAFNYYHQTKTVIFISADYFKVLLNKVLVDRNKNHLLLSYSDRTSNPLINNVQICSKTLENTQAVTLENPLHLNDCKGII